MSYNKIQIGRINTSEKEIIDILKAWLVISVAFAIVLSRSFSDFYSNFVLAGLTVGIGFLLHELGHKFAAQKYGCFAEFRSFDQMLILALATSFFGVVFAAPGAVMIAGRVSKEKNGRISAAGPVINLALASIFLLLRFLPLPKLYTSIGFFGFYINSWLALFNMIPFWLFDGYKIWNWNKLAYGAILAVAFVFMAIQYFI